MNHLIKFFTLLIIMFAMGCESPLASVATPEIQAVETEPASDEPQPQEEARYLGNNEFLVAGNNMASGLAWYDMSTNGTYEVFTASKPTMVFIHGFAWSGGTASDVRFNSNLKNDFSNQGSGYQTHYKAWNCGIFNWKDANTPKEGYDNKSNILAGSIIKLIKDYSLDKTEIRLVSYSWGIHVAAPAAKQILKYIKENGKKILVTIDFLDPTTEHGYLESSIKGDLEWVTENQTAALKPGKKLIGLSVRSNFGFGTGNSWDHNAIGGFGSFFALTILPSIAGHVEAFSKGSDHWTVLEKYHTKASMVEPRHDGNSWTSAYTRGSNQIKKTWIEAKDWNTNKGPILGSEWHDVQRHYQKWYIKKAGHWKDVYWYSYTEYYLKGWEWKSRTKKVYRKEWVPDVWDYTWEPYPFKEKVLGHYVWDFM